jgi:hypothetical protein
VLAAAILPRNHLTVATAQPEGVTTVQTDEQVKAGYHGAVQMTAMEAGVIWSAFRSILAANAFLIAVDAALIKVFPQLRSAATVVAAAGIPLCLAWFFVLMRQFSYFRYWLAWARSIEQAALTPTTRMFELGKTYGEGAEIKLPHGGSVKMSWAGKIFKVQWLAGFVVAIFLFLYVALLVKGLAA